jgi:hypothetical protein
VTIYELLRRFVEVAPFAEPERFDALKLIGELEDINALGTVAKQTEVQAHECRYVRTAAGTEVCVSCAKPKPRNAPRAGGPWPSSDPRIGSWP